MISKIDTSEFDNLIESLYNCRDQAEVIEDGYSSLIAEADSRLASLDSFNSKIALFEDSEWELFNNNFCVFDSKLSEHKERLSEIKEDFNSCQVQMAFNFIGKRAGSKIDFHLQLSSEKDTWWTWRRNTKRFLSSKSMRWECTLSKRPTKTKWRTWRTKSTSRPKT